MTSSLFKSMSLDSVTLEQALELLSLPRTVGVDPANGEEIIARNGRYGPYLQRGTDSRSLEEEEQPLDGRCVDAALALFAQPKQRRFGQQAAAAKEMGIDPDTQTKILLRQGRFGPYVTDGTTNASLRRGDDAEELTFERAVELLAEKRAAGPSTKRARGAKKVGAKKTGAKKAAKKTAAKKTTVKKTGAKKTAAKKTAAKKVTAKKVAPKMATLESTAGPFD